MNTLKQFITFTTLLLCVAQLKAQQDTLLPTNPPIPTKNSYLSFGIWLGGIHQTGNLANYFNSTRIVWGLNITFNYKRLGIGYGYDIMGTSQLKKDFVFKNITLLSRNKDFVSGGINVYLPISYRIFESKKLWLSPYIAPTYNTVDFRDKQAVIDFVNTGSFTFGLNFEYISNQTSIIVPGRFNKKSMITSCLYGSIFVNPYNFNSTYMTPLNTTAIGLRLGITGYFQREK